MGSQRWQDYALSDGSGLTRLAKDRKTPHMRWGFWACPVLRPKWGCWTSAGPKRRHSGGRRRHRAVATVGQLGKLKGCRVDG